MVCDLPKNFAYFSISVLLSSGIFLLLPSLVQKSRYKFSIFFPGLYLMNGYSSLLVNNLNRVSNDIL